MRETAIVRQVTSVPELARPQQMVTLQVFAAFGETGATDAEGMAMKPAVTREIQLAAVRYVRGPGVLDDPSLWAGLGRRALVVGGRRALGVAAERLVAVLDDAGILSERRVFDGEVCETERDAVIARAREAHAEAIIGVGGGKAIDTAKWAASGLGVPFAAVPTSAATCACAVGLIITYDAAGVPNGGSWARRSPDLVVVDTEVIGAAPARLLAAGLADALPKYLELSYNGRGEGAGLSMDLSVGLGLRLFERLVVLRPASLPAPESQPFAELLDSCFLTNGVLGNLVAREYRLAASHAIDVGLLRLQAPRRDHKRFLHGERVAYGNLVQAVLLEPLLPGLFERISDFNRAFALPCRLTDVGLAGDSATMAQLAEGAWRPSFRDGPARMKQADLEGAIAETERRAR
jgi:glycerol dehydrogenase